MKRTVWGGVAVGVWLVLPVAGLLWMRAGPVEVGGWRRTPRLTGDEFLGRLAGVHGDGAAEELRSVISFPRP